MEWVFAGLLVVAGYVVGIVGFFMGLTTRRELRELQRRLAHGLPAAPIQSFVAGTPAPVPQPQGPVQDLPAKPEPAPELIAEPVAEPIPEPVAALPLPPPKPKRDLESVLTMQWGVWLGAIALLLAGVFLIRYAVDQGLLGPAARVVLAALLGVALIAGAEYLRRRSTQSEANPDVADPGPMGLAAGGAAILFGAAYGAGPFYDLVPPLAGFALLAAAAFVGLAVSLRFGQLAAAVGVAGAYITPLLVSTDNPSLPGLFGYLFVVTAAALGVVRYTAWIWLGWTSTVAAALWAFSGGVMLNHVHPPIDDWAPSLFVPAAAALNLFLLPRAALDHKVGRVFAWIPFVVLGVVGVFLGGLFQDTVSRAGLLILSPLALYKAAHEPRLDRLPWYTAFLFLLVPLLWDLPPWTATGETITVEGAVQAVLPGGFAPAVLIPLLSVALLGTALYIAAGLLMERRSERPLRWAALAASVPVLMLLVTYAKVGRFQPDIVWAFGSLVVMAGLIATAAMARREGGIQRAGAHATGAVAALAFGCALLLGNQWLTVAIALFLPPLAWIEARADLPPLRRIALVVAGVVLVRLLLNWYVLDYELGRTIIVNNLLIAYGIPAAGFAIAAVMFRRRADDLTVAVLESGAIAFATVLIALEIRHALTHGDLRGANSFLEITLHVAALAVEATALHWLATSRPRPTLRIGWQILGGLALFGGGLLLLINPAITNAPAGSVALFAGYLLPAALAALALRKPDIPKELGIYALLAGLVWIGLQIRIAFHPEAPGLDRGAIEDAELWLLSAAWLSYGAALLALGIVTGGKALRLAALAIVALVTAKIFLIDMAGLTGLGRVLSFLGLGLALIALGAVYRRFVVTTPPPP